MKPIRTIRTTALLLLVGGMFAGSLAAQGHSQDRGKAKGHDKQQQKQDRGNSQNAEAQHEQGVADRQAQQQSIDQQRQREATYRAGLTGQLRAAQNHAAQLHKQNRRAQLAAHQQYLLNLQQQQQRLQARRDYARDPAISARPVYRYVHGGTQYQTTQYGAAVLRQAVNNGYQQGFQAGQADRRDGWQSNYQNTFAYQDANYGYDAQYVSQSDYNYYFREGVRRGYLDGYGTSPQYGTVANGSPSILSSVLSSILGLVAIKQ